MKSQVTFNNLWNLANIWTISHLYLVIKELTVPTQYCESILKNVLEDKTAYDILMYCDHKIKKQLIQMILKCIADNSQNKNKLKHKAKKLKNVKPKPMTPIEGTVVPGSGTKSQSGSEGIVSDYHN